MSSFSDFFKTKKDKEDFYIALVVISVFLIGGFYFTTSWGEHPSTVAAVDDNMTFPIESNGFGFETEADEALAKPLLKDKNRVKELDDWLQKTPSMDSSQVTVFSSQDSLLEIENTPHSVDRLSTNAIIDSVYQDTLQDLEAAEIEAKIKEEARLEAERLQVIQDSLAKVQKDSIAKLKKQKPAKPLKKQPAKSPKSTKSKATNYDCVIILGSFKVGASADNLKATLNKQGYPAFTFFRKQLKVVGIKASSKDEAALQRKLKEMRKKYPEAWILRKQ